jgi:hypothetical protein
VRPATLRPASPAEVCATVARSFPRSRRSPLPRPGPRCRPPGPRPTRPPRAEH